MVGERGWKGEKHWGWLELDRTGFLPQEKASLAEQMYGACWPEATWCLGACTTQLLDIMSTQGWSITLRNAHTHTHAHRSRFVIATSKKHVVHRRHNCCTTTLAEGPPMQCSKLHPALSCYECATAGWGNYGIMDLHINTSSTPKNMLYWLGCKDTAHPHGQLHDSNWQVYYILKQM